MNLLTIAYKSLRQRWLASFLTGLSVALGVALMVAVIVLNGVVTDVFRQSGSGYDLVVGPKGSDTQLVLSTIYHIDKPIENLPWRFYQDLGKHRHVERAIPVNLGDTTEIGNFPIVGTTPQYFLVDYVPDKKFRIKGDGLQGTWDAVIGSQVARQNNWDVGSQFKMIHSGQDDHVHNELFTVKGVLAPTGTPNDRTTFVHIDGFFQLDEHAKPLDEAIEREAKFFGETEQQVRERYKDDIAEIEKHQKEEAGHEGHHHHHGPPSDLLKEVTSVLLVMKGKQDYQRALAASTLQSDLKEGFQAQGVNVVQVMSRLLTNLVGNIRYAFLSLTILIIAVSGIGIFVSIYNSMSDRKKEIAIMRALGARRSSVLSIVLLEATLLCVLGGLGGMALGHGLVFVAAPIIEARSGLLIDPMSFNSIEFVVIPGLVAMAMLIGLLPGITAYRTDVAEALQG
ncbi:ABC transporter permease [Planctomicrobium piriforme]|uniref:Putative ABC transport system permease protein n=1 Tax=Planctomicrobium piriforme TaxID=1576369 RepID=A0A1I3SUZ4_9PLAN|nr:ABC transporter permease [Planctomicrobium piriforme]SFJ62658.1 putative ABC transport system permease protein [Planctomicrobium piriforme]